MSLESSLQRHREDAIKWKRSVLKIKLDASTEMLSCEESNARRAHILQDALRNEESRSRRLEESLACSRAEVAHERHLRVVLEKKAEERSRQFDSAESSLRMEMEELRKRAGALKIDAVSAMESLRERTMQADVLRDTLNALESKEEMALHNRVANLTTQFVTQKSLSGELQIELNRLRNVAIDVTSRERLRRRQRDTCSRDDNVTSQLALRQVPIFQRRLDQVQDDLSAEQRECVRGVRSFTYITDSLTYITDSLTESNTGALKTTVGGCQNRCQDCESTIAGSTRRKKRRYATRGDVYGETKTRTRTTRIGGTVS